MSFVDKNTVKKIMDLQDAVKVDPEYRNLMKKHTILNEHFLNQLETMNPKQRNAVTDYFGLLIEIHMKILEYAVK